MIHLSYCYLDVILVQEATESNKIYWSAVDGTKHG